MRKTAFLATCLLIFFSVNLALAGQYIQELTKRAERGDAMAQDMLGVMYEYGTGVSKNYSKALKWFRKAAERGDAAAQYNLGAMYYVGKGTPQNYAEAIKWYRKAAEQGNAGAQNTLGVAYANGQGTPQNYVKAYVWFSIASANGQERAKKEMEMLTPKMTPQQIAQAKQEAAKLWKKLPHHNN